MDNLSSPSGIGDLSSGLPSKQARLRETDYVWRKKGTEGEVAPLKAAPDEMMSFD